MISVIVPVLNEPALDGFLKPLTEALSLSVERWEVLIVKGDKEKLGVQFKPHPKVRVVTSYGDSLERGILTGFSHAQGNRLVVMDADGSHPPQMVLRLVRELDRYELAVGSRFVEGSEFRGSAKRSLVTVGFKAAARLAGSRLRDPMSGFFAVRRDVVDRTRFKPVKWKTCLEIELKARPTTVEVPIRFEERTQGKSKAGAKTAVRLMADIVEVKLSG